MGRPRVDDERREQILSAFETCVARKGLPKTTLQDVADESGLPRPLVRYFVGNRSDMVGRLIDRMVERAEKELGDLPGGGSELMMEGLLDVLFTKTFSNETTNIIIDELWYLAGRDEDIRARLHVLYADLRKRIVLQMEQEGYGRNKSHREDIAQALMSLGYGDASFKFLNLDRKTSTRAMAGILMASAQAVSAD